MPRASSRSSSSARPSSSAAGCERRRGGVVRRRGPGQAQDDGQRHEPLLGAVVQVALEPAAAPRRRCSTRRARDSMSCSRVSALAMAWASSSANGRAAARRPRGARRSPNSDTAIAPHSRPHGPDRRGDAAADPDRLAQHAGVLAVDAAVVVDPGLAARAQHLRPPPSSPSSRGARCRRARTARSPGCQTPTTMPRSPASKRIVLAESAPEQAPGLLADRRQHLLGGPVRRRPGWRPGGARPAPRPSR